MAQAVRSDAKKMGLIVPQIFSLDYLIRILYENDQRCAVCRKPLIVRAKGT